MRKFACILITLLLSLNISFGQKVGYVNTKTILAQIPEYVSAQQTLEKLNKQYQDYIDGERGKIQTAYQKYQNERPRLSEGQKQSRENEIIQMERKLQEKQKEYFGEEGIMARKSQELISPIKARVDMAIEKVAKERGYSILIDISAMQGVVYKDDTFDLSLEVIKNL